MQQLALKKSSNNELFEHIKNALDEELNDREFKLMNIEKNFTKDGHALPHKTFRHILLKNLLAADTDTPNKSDKMEQVQLYPVGRLLKQAAGQGMLGLPSNL